MSAKRFFYAAAGLFLLVAAYSVGAGKAQSQSSDRVVGITSAGRGGRITNSDLVAITESGNVYHLDVTSGIMANPWTHTGNVFAGGTIPVEGTSWGAVKQQFQGKK